MYTLAWRIKIFSIFRELLSTPYLFFVAVKDGHGAIIKIVQCIEKIKLLTASVSLPCSLYSNIF